MARITWGAETLIEQARALRDEVEVDYGEPDGLDVIRTVRFDKDTSRWLGPVLAVQLDPRIKLLDMAAGYLSVTFQEGVIADERDPFPLAAVDRVLNEVTGPPAPDVDPYDVVVTKKAPAKKAAPRKP